MLEMECNKRTVKHHLMMATILLPSSELRNISAPFENGQVFLYVITLFTKIMLGFLKHMVFFLDTKWIRRLGKEAPRSRKIGLL